MEQSIARYLVRLDAVDRYELSEVTNTPLKEKLTKLKSEMAKLDAIEQLVLAAPDQRIS